MKSINFYRVITFILSIINILMLIALLYFIVFADISELAGRGQFAVSGNGQLIGTIIVSLIVPIGLGWQGWFIYLFFKKNKTIGLIPIVTIIFLLAVMIVPNFFV